MTAIGGGSRSRYWLKAIATALGIPVDLPADGDFGAAFGAARLGLIAAETCRSARGLHPAGDGRDASSPIAALTERVCRRLSALSRALSSNQRSVDREHRFFRRHQARSSMKDRKAPTRSPIASTTRTRSSPASASKTICASPSPTGIPSRGRAAIRSAARPSSDPGSARRWKSAKLKADVAFEMFSLLGVPYLLLPRCRRAAGSVDLRRKRCAPRRDRRLLRRKAEEDRRQAALGHGQPVLEPPLHVRRGDQPRSRRVCLSPPRR